MYVKLYFAALTATSFHNVSQLILTPSTLK